MSANARPPASGIRRRQALLRRDVARLRRRAARCGRAVMALGACAAVAGVLGAQPVAAAAQPAAVVAGPAAGGYQRNILSPAHRSLAPVSLYRVLPRGGSVNNPQGLVHPDGRPTVLDLPAGNQSSSPLVILDMGREVGGLVTVTVTGISSPAPTLNACFSESTAYMALSPSQNDGESRYAPGCDTANINNGLPRVPYTYNSDGHLIPVNPAKVPGSFTDSQIRGGFRYLTLYLSSPGRISISAVRVDFTAAPAQAHPANYAGYFLSSSNELNKLWYSGAYTVQLDTAAASTLKKWPYVTGETDHADAQMPHTTGSEEVILDGAKRDRDVWQGDLSVEGPVTALSTGDLAAWRNSLAALAAQQAPNGYVPAEGLVGNHNLGEEFNYGTYVMWFVNNMDQYWQYTGDRSFLTQWFPALQKAEAFLGQQVDSTGLLTFSGTGIRGVGPNADGGKGACGTYGYELCGHLSYVNSLYYLTLTQMAQLASAAGNASQAGAYQAEAQKLRAVINARLWNPTAGAYELSPSHPAVFPQDAQAMAVTSGVASPAQATAALRYLRQNTWAPFGSLTVSPLGTSSPVPAFYGPLASGFELAARYDASTTPVGGAIAEQLMTRLWGHMLSANYGPQSTFWEKLNQEGLPGIQQFTSLAHGWASEPTVVLTTDVLGVQPVTAGFSTYLVKPHPGTLRWARGRVPTLQGSISVSWRRGQGGAFQLSVASPGHSRGEVGVPTSGAKVRVTVDGRVVWNGTTGSAYGAHLSGQYVMLDGLPAGTHTITAAPLSALPTVLRVYVNPGSQSLHPGVSGVLRVSIYADGPGTITGNLTANGPAGWNVRPLTRAFALRSDGTPVHERVYVHYLGIPASAAGSYQIHVRATTSGGATAQTSATLTVTKTVALYDFANNSTQGWQAGPGVASVAAVQSFANGPGHCYPGTSCLAANSDSIAANAPRVSYVAPATPLDLAGATSLGVYLDGYGGAPGRTGYSATITLASGTHTLSTTALVSANTWNKVLLNVSGWPYLARVGRISVSFSATGTTTPWQMQYQLGQVFTVSG